jgi:hypothetical protein
MRGDVRFHQPAIAADRVQIFGRSVNSGLGLIRGFIPGLELHMGDRQPVPIGFSPQGLSRVILVGARVAVVPGPSCSWSRDWLKIGRALDVDAAWELSQRRYAGEAIIKRLGEDFHAAIAAILPGVYISVGVIATTTGIGAGVGAIFGGVGAAPGAAAGFTVGVWILNVLGLGFLAVYVGKNIAQVAVHFGRATKIAWNSCGDSVAIDAAAKEYAEGIAVLFSLLIQAVIAYIAKKGMAAATEKLSTSSTGRALSKWCFNNRTKLEVDRIANEVLINPRAPDLVRGRIETAAEFFEQYRTRLDEFEGGLSQKKADKWYKAIDFSKPVKRKWLKKGDRLVAFANSDPAKVGNFYTKLGTGAENLGIVAKGRQFTIFEVLQDIEVLESRTSGLGPDARRAAHLGESPFTGTNYVDGGGVQYTLPSPKARLVEVRRGWPTQDRSLPPDVAAKNLKDILKGGN